MKLIHYGNTIFDKNLFLEIENIPYFNKPNGGLWTSPINSNFGWINWCISENFRLKNLESFFTLEIKDEKILTIDTLNDYKELPFINNNYIGKSYYKTPDFEKIKLKYDAIYLTECGESATRLFGYKNCALYGWDCECVLILNMSCIIKINDNEYQYN